MTSKKQLRAEGDPDDQPEADSTSVDEVNRFSGGTCLTCWPLKVPELPRHLHVTMVGQEPSLCGFARHCATIPSAWVPGSVTR